LIALGLAALIALLFGGHIDIAPVLQYNILLQDNIFKSEPLHAPIVDRPRLDGFQQIERSQGPLTDW